MTQQKVDRERCIVGALDGLERTRVSLKLWIDKTETQVERNAVRQLLTKVEDLLNLTANFSRLG